jgi:hypothetical protein
MSGTLETRLVKSSVLTFPESSELNNIYNTGTTQTGVIVSYGKLFHNREHNINKRTYGTRGKRKERHSSLPQYYYRPYFIIFHQIL